MLSTASPAINAWMNPSNRFAIRVVHMVRSTYRRSTGIVACLMAEALDVQGIHIPIKVIILSCHRYHFYHLNHHHCLYSSKYWVWMVNFFLFLCCLKCFLLLLFYNFWRILSEIIVSKLFTFCCNLLASS